MRRRLLVGRICFDVRWLDEPLDVFRTPNPLPVTTGSWFEQREAARFSLYKWDEYERLSGTEQSAIVAYYRLYNKLNALIDQWQSQQVELKARRAGRIRRH